MMKTAEPLIPANAGLFDEVESINAEAPATRNRNATRRLVTQRSYVRNTMRRIPRQERPDTDDGDRRVRWYLAAGEVCWFEHSRHLIPPRPFTLSPGVRVLDVAAFLAVLDRDIAAGPDGPRASSVLEELSRLRDLFNQPPP